MVRVISGIIVAVGLAGCTSQAQLDQTAFQRQFQLQENYQAVYARSNRQMRACNQASYYADVDGQLYPDLDYGEIVFGTSGGFVYSPFNVIRVERNGAGALVKLKTLTMAEEGTLEWLEYWARGGTRCPKVHYSETPPPIT
ncbi:hypothetical protein [Tranquillimonas alkanivorans]|uniref:Lipoprotein n=1 Tax=Tranquillimonas alkanivorans TaxID=441119 RepID=A0A1I5L1H6_9RHOB|nr:hypothetical protein [Tranquillimonas alkanivorans]SFO91125.1 hypothetical protein SAMN04488047_101414 [Tranquillimonas alkanivorans]